MRFSHDKKTNHIVIDARNRRSSTGRYTDRLIEHLQTIDPTNQYTVLLQANDNWQPTAKNFSSKVCDFEQFSFNPIDQIKFATLLYRLRPSLVHFTMTQQPLLYFGKTVTTTHDLTMLRSTRPSRFSKTLHKLGMAFYRLLFWWSHKKSNKIIVPSNYVKADLAKLEPFTTKKTVVTYESSEPPIKGAAQPLKGVSKPFVFHVGGALPHKNIDRLIKAFGLAKQKHSDLQLVLPGKSPEVFEKDLMSWINKSKYKQDIIKPGFVSDAELKWLYKNAACYVLPSLSEGFGLPGLEAMAHGTPVVSSNATCLPEIYQEAAYYFDPANPEDIAQKISDVLDDKHLQDNLVNLGKKQINKYSWQTMAEQTLSIYKSILDS